jgi:adenylosuccinate synthase
MEEAGSLLRKSALFPYFLILVRFQGLAAVYQRMFPDLQVDVDAELVRYKVFAERIQPYVVESVSYLHSALRSGQKVLVEGANAAMLDIDFGTYFQVACSL